MAENFDSTLFNKCRIHPEGHDIVSLEASPVVDVREGKPVFVAQRVIICRKCGTPLEEIQKTRRSGRSGNGKKAKSAFAVEEGAEKGAA